MKFNKIVLVLFVTILGISWARASAIYLYHKQPVDIPAPLGYYDGHKEPPEEGEYRVTEDVDTTDGNPDPRFRNQYEAQISKIDDYITGPRDKYIKIVTPTSYTSGHDPLLTSDTAALNISLFKQTLEKPDLRNKYALLMVEIALKRIKESSDDLEDMLNQYLVDGNLVDLQNNSHLAAENYQHEIRVILLNTASTKLMLLDMQKILDSFLSVSSTTTFIKNINGVSLEQLISYTASVLGSVRGSWVEWKLTLYYIDKKHLE